MILNQTYPRRSNTKLFVKINSQQQALKDEQSSIYGSNIWLTKRSYTNLAIASIVILVGGPCYFFCRIGQMLNTISPN